MNTVNRRTRYNGNAETSFNRLTGTRLSAGESKLIRFYFPLNRIPRHNSTKLMNEMPPDMEPI
jgi:hypothetical protein